MATGSTLVQYALEALHRLGESLLTLGIGVYKISPDLDHFASKLDELQYRKSEWVELLSKGLGRDSTINVVLKDAITLVRNEEGRLRIHRNRSKLFQCFASSKPLEFSKELLESVQKVITEFESLRMDKSRRGDLWDGENAPGVHRDRRYVPQTEILGRVREAVECRHGPPVVVLHGGPGLGKSSLVRHLATEYDSSGEPEKLDLSINVGPMESPSEESFVGFPDGVVYLDGGVEADCLTSHLKLLQATGGSVAVVDHGTFLPKGAELRRRLQNWWADKNILVIIDDVVDMEFLERLVVRGCPGVKYLVTSELKEEVWQQMSNVQVIEMKRMELKEARQILADQIGMPWGQIPPRLEEIVNDIIKKLDNNPLLLTDIAMTINREKREDVDEWRAARENLLDLIFKENVVTFGLLSAYPRCAPCTMTMALDSLPEEAKTLLLLVAVCRGPTVPEVILRILFKKHVGSLLKWFECKKLLEARELVRVHAKSSTITTWSIHPMRKKFVIEKRRTELAWIMECMFRDSDLLDGILYTERERLLAVVCVFYGNKYTSEIGFQKLKFRFDNSEIRRLAVEPILWLLDPDFRTDWKGKSYVLARQALLRYACQGILEQDSFSGLLASPFTAASACAAIETIANFSTQEVLLKVPNSSSAVLDSLLKLLQPEVLPSDQKAAASALGALAVRNFDLILSSPLTLERLVDLLDKSFNPVVQASVLLALGNLAQSSESIKIIGAYPGMLEGLVELLDTFVSKEAAYAIARMTSLPSNFQAEIASYSLAVDRLLHLSHATDVSGETQAYAMRALANISWSKEGSLNLADSPTSLKALVDLLHEKYDLNPEIQEQTARCLAGLAAVSYENKVRIGAISNCIPNLIRLLAMDENPYVQEAVAVTLEYLALAEENRKIILLVPETLNTFQKMLTDGLIMTQNLRTSMVGLLATLLEVAENIVTLSRSVEVFVGLLDSKTSSPDLQRHAARALANLAAQGEAQKLSIATTPGALENLLALLAKEVSDEVKHQALKALANLCVSQKIRAMLSSNTDLVNAMVELLQADVLPSLELHAARILTFLDPTRSRAMTLHSVPACYGRAEALMEMEIYEQAMSDLVEVGQAKPLDTFFIRRRSFAKAMLKDYEGALMDADKAVELQPLIPILWHERGICKRLTGDLEGALNDFERALELANDDYESIKHRAYVKFLLKDEKGAREDAERAVQIMKSRDAVGSMKRMPSHIDAGKDRERFLGRHPLSFLDYTLR
ncbi:hypothetical protein R1flu_007512 [Riccia fluitans]|uniref:Protein unc-45 homolog B n=1 Tax=Riccia fluitans TaxID=41844 RepID=A0ABD1YZ30_9MARC